jgi:hypothetical protein
MPSPIDNEYTPKVSPKASELCAHIGDGQLSVGRRGQSLDKHVDEVASDGVIDGLASQQQPKVERPGEELQSRNGVGVTGTWRMI